MKKVFVAVLMFFVVVALAGTSSAWQGRMNGMDNPQGLIGDESDFLIHPAKIVYGEGVRYYLDYQFTYTDFIHMDSNLNWYDAGSLEESYHNNATSAHQYDHNSLLGAAFPLCKGRLGVFFTYDKKMGDFDGNTDYDGELGQFDSDSDLDNYALKFIYGLPLRSMDFGLELGFAYRSEEQKESFQENDLLLGTKNNVWPWEYFDAGFFPFMIPYDSSYWELFWKAGVGKKLNAVDINWSVQGGYILSSDSENRYENIYEYSPGGNEYHAKADGDVRGYRIGSDLWIRHQVNDNGLSLPFLVSVEYAKKDRDGDGYGTGSSDYGDLYQYEHITRTFEIKAGGGIEKEVKGCSRVGGGLYYKYLQSRDDLWFDDYGNIYNNTRYPSNKEHRLVLNLAGEREVTSDFTLRGGLDFFYGWVVSDDYKSYVSDGDIVDISLDGKNWGIGASLGASKKFSCVTLEPFMKAGYREFDVNGNGSWGTGDYRGSMDKLKTEWFTACGLSVLFGK